VISRAPSVSVRTPKPLILLPGAGAEPAAADAASAPAGEERESDSSAIGASDEPRVPLASDVWRLRVRIEQARDALIELRVHASSPSINTPQGQARRGEMLEALFGMIHVDDPEQPVRHVDVAMFNCEKGQKLLSELLPLWPPTVVHAMLMSFISQLPTRGREQTSAVARALATKLANAPKGMQPNECEALLRAITAHGSAVVKQSLQRADVNALLLGILCRGDQGLEPLAEFYGVLLPLAATCEPPWALLNAALPTVEVSHAALLQEAMRLLQPEAMTDKCSEAREAFSQRLQQRLQTP